MRKNEANYTPWGSLSMKNLVNRLLGGGGGGTGNRCWLIRICLFEQGDTSVCWGSNEWGFGWTVFSLQVAGLRRTEIFWSKDETHVTSETGDSRSFHSGVGTQDGPEPQTPTEYECVARSRKVCQGHGRGVSPASEQEAHSQALPNAPLPPAASTASLGEKTCFADALTELDWIWHIDGLSIVSWV